MEYRWEKIPCDLCGSDRQNSLFKAKDLLHGVPGEFPYVKCESCGLVFMNPRPVSENLGELYPETYGPHQNRERKEIRGRKLYRRINIKKNYLNQIGPTSRVLDIGCGNGFFLHCLRKEVGCHVSGMDFSPGVSRTARDQWNIDVVNCTIENNPFEDNSFDVITAWWYFEHIPNPSEAFKRAKRLLKPGGLLIFGVPNFESFNAHLFKTKWYHLDCPRHLFIYSPQTVSRYFAKTGFRLEYIDFQANPKGLVKSLMYCLNGRPEKRPAKKPRGLNTLKRLLLPFAYIIKAAHKTDEIVIYARKG